MVQKRLNELPPVLRNTAGKGVRLETVLNKQQQKTKEST